MSSYLERPTAWQCAQWTGDPAASPDLQNSLAAVGWSWTVDPDGIGYALTPTGARVPLPTGTWVATGNGSIQFIDAAAFPQRFVAGSTWAVAP